VSGPNAEDGYGMHPPAMTPQWQARGEVIATIVAHSDRGDGYCETCLEVDPCGTRRWHEGVLGRMRR
jgi:hypothetical protein